MNDCAAVVNDARCIHAATMSIVAETTFDRVRYAYEVFVCDCGNCITAVCLSMNALRSAGWTFSGLRIDAPHNPKYVSPCVPAQIDPVKRVLDMLRREILPVETGAAFVSDPRD